MSPTYRSLLKYLCLALLAFSQGAAAEAAKPQLPAWQVVEFEEKAFWATARSRLEVVAVAGTPWWDFTVSSSVVGNSEELLLRFDPQNRRALKRERISRGKEQRLKSFIYEPQQVVRERRNPGANQDAPVDDWTVTSHSKINFPTAASELPVVTPHLLILLAQQLQSQGPDKSIEVLVHTDFNFYRVRLTCGNGIPIDVNYSVNGDTTYSGRRDTVAVALQVNPEGELSDKADFSLLGLQDEIILFFDKNSGLPLQVRGVAPRIGATEIDLKSVTLRPAKP